RFGFLRLPAALAGLAASLIATNSLYGFDFSSYVWRGWGLYTQIWGMFLLPLALAEGYAVLRDGRGYFWAALLLAGLLLSHLVSAYLALASLVLLSLLPSDPRDVWRRLKRLAILSVPVLLATAYFVVPF